MTSPTLSRLNATQSHAVEAFLATHPYTTSTLRRLAQQELADSTTIEAGLWVGAFADGILSGILFHGRDGIVRMQADTELPQLCTELMQDIEKRQTVISGFSGDHNQILQSLKFLGLQNAACRLKTRYRIFTLTHEQLCMPPVAQNPALTCRRATKDDQVLAGAWRHAYEQEILGASATEQDRIKALQTVSRWIEGRKAFFLEDRGKPVSLSVSLEILSDQIEVGSVYTPPSLRGRGYARAVIAHQVQQEFSDRPVKRAMLITNDPAGMRAYRALGFQELPSPAYGLVLFTEPLRPPSTKLAQKIPVR